MKILLIDDQLHCMELLAIYIKETPGAELISMETNSEKAYQMVRDKVVEPDVIFLDVQMPKLDGVAFMDLIQDLPILVVLTTAHRHYGPESHKYKVADYLMKPITKKDFDSSIANVKERMNEPKEIKTGIDANLLTIPGDGKSGHKFLELDKILYIEASNTYVFVYTIDGMKHFTNYTMQRIERLLSQKLFMRVHKSFMVNLRKMEKSDFESITLLGGTKIDLGEKFRDRFLKTILPDSDPPPIAF